jgi:hypothetical protein
LPIGCSQKPRELESEEKDEHYQQWSAAFEKIEEGNRRQQGEQKR